MTESSIPPARGEVTLLDFWADWCGICRLIDPVVKRVVSGHSGVVLKKINVAEEKDVADRHRVAALPTLVFLGPDGRELGRMSGSMTGKQIEASLEDAMNKSD
jgi:thioredoxin-like negative regulator of GroEL